MWAGGALAAGLLLAAAGCGGEERAASTVAGAEATALQAIPPRALELCLGRPLLRVACPRRVPRAGGYRARIIPRTGLGYATLDVHVSWPHGDPVKNRPPRFVHVVVEGGRVEAGMEFARRPATGPLSHALARPRADALVVGERRWGGRTGTLLLAPSFERSSTLHGDHLVFLWHEAGAPRLVSLHAWAPIEEAAATLRAMVESIPSS